jgi:hypothetical protein
MSEWYYRRSEPTAILSASSIRCDATLDAEEEKERTRTAAPAGKGKAIREAFVINLVTWVPSIAAHRGQNP